MSIFEEDDPIPVKKKGVAKKIDKPVAKVAPSSAPVSIDGLMASLSSSNEGSDTTFFQSEKKIVESVVKVEEKRIVPSIDYVKD